MLSDVLDGLGLRIRRCRLYDPPARRRPGDGRLARTGLYREVYEVRPDENRMNSKSRWSMICGRTMSPYSVVRGRSASRPGASCCLPRPRTRRGGCVTDGFVRDIRAIRRMGFPVFHAGMHRLIPGRGKVADINVPIACAGVRIAPATWSSATPTESSSFHKRSRPTHWTGRSQSARREPHAEELERGASLS